MNATSTLKREHILNDGDRILIARRALRLRQYELAARAHIAPSTLSAIERGQRPLDDNSRRRLSAALGVTL